MSMTVSLGINFVSVVEMEIIASCKHDITITGPELMCDIDLNATLPEVVHDFH